MGALFTLLGVEIVRELATSEPVKNTTYSVLGNFASEWLKALFRREDKPIQAFEKACDQLKIAENRVARRKLDIFLANEAIQKEFDSVHRIDFLTLEKWFEKLGISSRNLPEFLYVIQKEMIEDEHIAQIKVISEIIKGLKSSISKGQKGIEQEILDQLNKKFDELKPLVTFQPLSPRVSLVGQSYLPYRPSPFLKDEKKI